MIKFLITAFSFFLHLSQAGVQLKNTPTEKKVILDKEALSVLKKWDPNFTVFQLNNYPRTVVNLFSDAKQELPMAILADFNGDHQKDIALMGHNKTKERIVILVAQKNSYVAVEVRSRTYTDPASSFINTDEKKREKGLGFYLSLLSSQDLRFAKNTKRTFKPDALQLENYGGETSAYYLKHLGKNKFEVKEYKGIIE
jgi:hypothetical protein